MTAYNSSCIYIGTEKGKGKPQAFVNDSRYLCGNMRPGYASPQNESLQLYNRLTPRCVCFLTEPRGMIRNGPTKKEQGKNKKLNICLEEELRVTLRNKIP